MSKKKCEVPAAFFLDDPERMVETVEECLRVRGRDGVLQPLKANAVQKAFERRRGRENIVLKARQMGMTTWVSARFFLRTISMPGTLTVQVAHTRAAAEAIFRMVQRMYEHLPKDVMKNMPAVRANVGQMMFENDSEFRVWSAGDENAGRGLSIQNLHCSEVSRWPGDAKATLAGLRAALAPEGELVLESTANGKYGAFYGEWCGGVEQASGFREQVSGGMVRHFFPWWMEPAYVGAAVGEAEMREDERELVQQYGLSAEQIGFRRGLERSYGKLRAQEFAEDAESCFKATGECCFEVQAIEDRMTELQEPMERRRGGALLVWFAPVAGKEYVVAVDPTGGGVDGDYAAVQVVERATGLQCAELQERLRPADLSREVAKLAREYCGAMVAVESNNHGSGVIAHLGASEKYTRLYREVRDVGRLTTASSKMAMVARMSALLTESAEMFMSRRLLGECRTFVTGKNGRASAASGAHDDLVMAMALAQMVR